MNRVFLSSVLLASLLAAAGPAEAGKGVIIKCAGNCDVAAENVVAAGGSITYRYRYVDAIAATIPLDLYARSRSIDGVAYMVKDVMYDEPKAVEALDIEEGFSLFDADVLDVNPLDYQETTLLTGVGPLFGQGVLGDGSIVAVIDTGTAPVTAFRRDGCATSEPTVIGGETFIARAGPAEPPATSTRNGPHGTQVGTVIAGNAIFLFAENSLFARAVSAYSPSSAIPGIQAGATGIPMLGTAPCSRIYALKTFLSAGGGAPRSDIAAAMERAIELRENYNAGVPSEPVSGTGTAEDPFVYDSLKIDVVNMSLGGPTTYAGNEITDLLTLKMLEVGITVVNSAGNSGHAAMTGGSAGTGFGTLTAGAASTAHNERILRDIQSGFGFGALYRPTDHIQMATFSSRGPSPDGRPNVDAVANGFANLVQGPTGGIGLVSGTSFSAPMIAGAAALLHDALPGVSALQVRNALVETADPTLLGDNSSIIDQGRGHINVAVAYEALVAGKVSNKLPSGPGSNSVRGNIASLGLKTIQPGNRVVRERISNLVPGQVAHFFVQTTAETEALEISFRNIRPELAPAQQNALFGDDLFVVVQDALTSAGATLTGGFIFSDTTLVAPRPQAGLVRIAVMGDWTNAGKISADMEIRAIRGNKPRNAARGRVMEGEFDFYSVSVPAGTAVAHFELQWQQDWGAYPTDDLDLIIVGPAGNPVFDGATLNSPERVTLQNPTPGEYLVFVDGFTVWDARGKRAQYALYAYDENGRAFRIQK